MRSKIGRVVSHPRALTVRASNGTVHITGPVLTAEVNDLLQTASHVPGVQELTHQLEIHETADVPSLQGGRDRPGYPSPLQRPHWKPATRLLFGSAGALVGLGSLRQKGLIGAVGGLAGAALVARAVLNEKMRKILGVDGSDDLFEVHKSLHVDAPVKAVFSFWNRVDNFPHFMRNVYEVVDRGSGRSHWTVSGPAGTTVEWEAEVVDRVENELIAWRTVEESSVHHAGVIQFAEEGENRTRVDVRLTYTPPGGAIGHAVATLFGADPKHELDEDLARMKTMITTGKVPHDVARRSGPNGGEEES